MDSPNGGGAVMVVHFHHKKNIYIFRCRMNALKPKYVCVSECMLEHFSAFHNGHRKYPYLTPFSIPFHLTYIHPQCRRKNEFSTTVSELIEPNSMLRSLCLCECVCVCCFGFIFFVYEKKNN